MSRFDVYLQGVLVLFPMCDPVSCLGLPYLHFLIPAHWTPIYGWETLRSLGCVLFLGLDSFLLLCRILLVVILRGGSQQERICLYTERHSCKSKVMFLTIYVKQEPESISILLSDAYLQKCFLNVSKQDMCRHTVRALTMISHKRDCNGGSVYMHSFILFASGCGFEFAS